MLKNFLNIIIVNGLTPPEDMLKETYSYAGRLALVITLGVFLIYGIILLIIIWKCKRKNKKNKTREEHE